MNCVLIVFAFLLSLATAETDFTSNSTTIVEFRNRNQLKKLKINFEAYTPQGLRVTVPSIHGIDLFSFQAKVNLPLFKRENGTLVWEIINPLDDKLVKEFPSQQLLVGDVINFWVRIQMNGVSLQSESLSHIIKETVPMNIGQQYSHQSPAHESASHQSASHQRPSYQSNSFQSPPHQSPPLAHSYTPPNQIVPSAKQCECNDNLLNDIWSQLNVTVAKMRTLDESVKPLEEKLNSLTEIVVELVKNMDIGTNLKLVGNLPVQTNPVEDVRHLIVEKLKLFDLRSTILQAEYTSSGISFEVSSSIDKLRILKRSNDILSKLSYQIIDPNQRPAIDFRMA
ncbi:uncharacterized protein LOC129906431 isoform X2 [Episyrphus balteatus]|uniref:uncharacterized protein LOC129906431 isoform X2 n=1 Tax=Episyrphus balteatus TaxID=286459 RepID=UPI002485C3B7|nr:uncharacterized protein LOC129906431 isoform X2 [Episyrphus balteatus]